MKESLISRIDYIKWNCMKTNYHLNKHRKRNNKVTHKIPLGNIRTNISSKLAFAAIIALAMVFLLFSLFVEYVTEFIKFIKDKFATKYSERLIDMYEIEHVVLDKKTKTTFESDLDISDDELDEAIEVVFAYGGASTSAVQRALKVSYGRAARLVAIMEQMGIVGPPDGNKPRQLLMSKESWHERKLNEQD